MRQECSTILEIVCSICYPMPGFEFMCCPPPRTLIGFLAYLACLRLFEVAVLHGLQEGNLFQCIAAHHRRNRNPSMKSLLRCFRCLQLHTSQKQLDGPLRERDCMLINELNKCGRTSSRRVTCFSHPVLVTLHTVRT